MLVALLLLLFFLPFMGMYFYFVRKYWRIRSLRIAYLLRAIGYTVLMGTVIISIGLGDRTPDSLDHVLIAALVLYFVASWFFRKPTPAEERALQDISAEIDHEFLGGPPPPPKTP